MKSLRTTPAARANRQTKSIMVRRERQAASSSLSAPAKPHFITRALDMGERVLSHPLFPLDPMIKGLVPVVRSGIRKVTGFDERLASPGEGTVTTMNAPVAFAREGGIKPRLNYLVRSDRGALVHVHDMFYGTSLNLPAASGYFLQLASVRPQYAGLFPNFATEFSIWEKYRIHALRFHYCHFAPTSTQAAVVLGFSQEQIGLGTIPSPTSTSQLMAYDNVVMGSAYEDFGLEVSPKTLQEVQGNGDFLWNSEYTGGGSGDPVTSARQQFCGTFCVATDNNPATSATTPIGYVFIEAVIEFVGQRSDAFPGIGRDLRLFASAIEGLTPEQVDLGVEYISHQIRERAHQLRSAPREKSEQPEFMRALVPSTAVAVPPRPSTAAQPLAPLSANVLLKR